MMKSTLLALGLLSLCLAVPATSKLQAAENELGPIRERLARGQQTRIVCFGDSITGVYYHSGGQRAWCDMLGYAIRIARPSAAIEMVNAGISGHTTVNALARIENDVLRKKPHLVVVMFGMNDVTRVPLETYRANMLEIAKRCQAGGSAVVLCTPNSVLANAARPNSRLAEYAEAVRVIAEAEDLPLVDCFAAWKQDRERNEQAWKLTMSDDIHPNMNGHRRFAELMATTITGRTVSLEEIGAPADSLRHTFDKLSRGETVKLFAMAPLDSLLTKSLQKQFPQAKFAVAVWPTQGQSVEQMAQWAKRIRGKNPDLVVPAPPHDTPDNAAGATADAYITSYEWVLNWSFQFAGRPWDVVPCLPLDKELPQQSLARLRLARTILIGKDARFIERAEGDERDPQAIVDAWVEAQLQSWRGANNVLPSKDGDVSIATQPWPHRPGPRQVRISVHYPAGTLESVNERTGVMLTLHNWGGVNCGGSANPTALATRLNVVAICVNYLQSGRQASVEDHRPYDYGLLQSVDALNALAYVRGGLKNADRPYDDARMFCTGGSGGGNVTQMANKLAPHTFACVVDMCGMKRLSDDIAFNRPGGSGLNARWSQDPQHPNYLSGDAQAIRYLGNPIHLREMKRGGAACKIVVVHGVDDQTCPFPDAVEMVDNMRTAQIDVEPFFISKKHLDRKAFLSSGHGLGNRTEIVFKVAGRYLQPDGPESLRRKGPSNFDRKTDIRYTTPNGRYVVSYNTNRVRVAFVPSEE